MKAFVLLISAAALSGCGYSVVDAAEDVGKMASSSSSGFSEENGGKKISTNAATVDQFTKLSLLGPDNVVFTVGDQFTIVAEGSSDAIEEIRYRFKDGKLMIGRRDHDGIFNSGTKGSATVRVTAPMLSGASLAGSGDMEIAEMKSESVKLSVAGSGNIDVENVESDSLKISVAGSGDMKLAGTSESGKISVAGSGAVKAKDLKIAEAKVSIAGSGDVSFGSDGNVKASLVGSGDVNVKGSARCTSTSIGSGDLNCSA